MNPFLFLEQTSMGLILILILSSLACSIISPCYGYDSLDPNGNITVKWDVLQSTEAVYDVTVSMFNYQLYRHIESPGWKLSWEWPHGEVIWYMQGAETTMQGNCSTFTPPLPHCCEPIPEIIDLLPGTPYNKQAANCCRGGVLSSMVQDPSKTVASFQLSVGIGNMSVLDMAAPARNFNLGLPGYTCGDPLHVNPPSRFTSDGGRRWTQALRTWNVTCMYTQHRASAVPTCCVSLTAFYSSAIVHCPHCSCGCQDLPGVKCVPSGETPAVLQLPHDPNEVPEPSVMCSLHLCPIRVHWHIKESYREYWRVKITIQNLNYAMNYSEWNLEVQHPNVRSLVEVFSFNHQTLGQHGPFNDSAMFWGIKYYNDLLLTAEKEGTVQTEVLFHKDPDMFTFDHGWAFPRRILFNGDECVMPAPDEFPRLPSSGCRISDRHSLVPLSVALLVLLLLLSF